MKYFCTSETIALYIQKYVQYRKRKVFFGATGKFADLLPQIIKHNTEKYFIPMSDVHNDEVKDLLDKNHIQHHGSCNVPYCQQRFHSRRRIQLRHADILQPGRYSVADEKLPEF